MRRARVRERAERRRTNICRVSLVRIVAERKRSASARRRSWSSPAAPRRASLKSDARAEASAATLSSARDSARWPGGLGQSAPVVTDRLGHSGRPARCCDCHRFPPASARCVERKTLRLRTRGVKDRATRRAGAGSSNVVPVARVGEDLLFARRVLRDAVAANPPR